MRKLLYISINKLYRAFLRTKYDHAATNGGWVRSELSPSALDRVRQCIKNEEVAVRCKPADVENPIRELRLGTEKAKLIQKIVEIDLPIREFCREQLGYLYIKTRCSLLFSDNQRVIQDSSQDFHFDWQAKNTVKIFINIDVVDQNNGPLQWLDAHDAAKFKHADRSMFVTGKKQRFKEASIKGFRVFDNCGLPGTVVMINTEKCLHRGSRKSKGSRLVLLIEYYPFFNYEPNYVMNCLASHNS